MSNKYIVKDDSGRDYEIPNIKRFHQHLVDFHSAEGTIHEENGYYFTVTPEFRQQVAEYFEQENSN